MSLFKSYQTDTESENDGRWISGAFRDEIALKLRSTHSKKAKEAQRKIDKRNRRYFASGDSVPPEIQTQNEAELACALVADWKNVTDENDAPMLCTDDTKRRVFFDESLWEFRQQVIGAANTADNFRKADEAAALGNSPLPSAGVSAPAATSAS